MNKKIILFINNFQGGGTGGVVATLANNVPDGWDVTVVTLDDSYFDFSLDKMPESLHFTRTHGVPEPIYCLWKIPMGIIRYTKLLRKYKPDISMSFLEIEGFINLISCKLTGVKAITSIRASPINPCATFFGRLAFNVDSYLGKFISSKIITNADGIKSTMVEMYNISPSKLEVIYNPKDIGTVDIQKLEPISEEFYDTDKKILITTGRLVHEKGIHHIIRVFAQVKQKIPSRLVICGDGILRDELEELTVSLGIRDDVLFTGWVHNPHKYIQNSDIFVFASLSEGQPNSLIDAVLVGCPIISSDCKYGPRDILDNGKYGILYPSFESEDNQDADTLELTPIERELMINIVNLLNDTDLQDEYRKSLLERREVFDKNRCINQFFKVFDDVIRG